MFQAFHKTVLSYIRLARSSASSPEGLAFQSLETFTTFRLPVEADHQKTIGFRVLFHTFREIWSGSLYQKSYESTSGVLILDGSMKSEEIRRNYVRVQSGEDPEFFLSKEAAVSGLRRSLASLLYLLFIGSFLAFRCFIVRKNRANRALHIRQIAENAVLLKTVKTLRPESIYHFSNCLIDNNWSYLLLHQWCKVYNRVLSPYAMVTHNRITLTDVLITSLPYHEDELKTLPDVQYHRIVRWVPESVFSYMDLYLGSKRKLPPRNSIGYYSHGSWVRSGLNNRSDNMGIDEAEHETLTQLSTFFTKHKDFHLLIFLHPKEKGSGWIEKAKDYYDQFFAPDSYSFANQGQKSSEAFDMVEVGIAVFTSIMFERLFAGYKTIIGAAKLRGFPVEGSDLNSIVFTDYEGLEKLIFSTLEVSPADFFTDFKVRDYHYTSFPSFTNYYKSKLDESE